MAEPEDVLIDAARHAAVAIGRLWRRQQHGRSGTDRVAAWLSDQRPRLGLLITATHGIEASIRVAQPPAPPSLLRRLLQPLPQRLQHARGLPATDGRHIFLPRRLSDQGGLPAARWYRALALQQAGRLRRGSAALPDLPPAGLAHTLYLLCEAAAVERAIMNELSGLVPDLHSIRTALLAERPPLSLLTAPEQAVEKLYRQLLRQQLLDKVSIPSASPTDSWRWAKTMAQQIETAHAGRFRGFLHDEWLGLLHCPATLATTSLEAEADSLADPTSRPASSRLRRRPEPRVAAADEDDDAGLWMLQMDDPQEHVEDPLGMQRPTDRDAGQNSDDVADSLSELPQARLVATPEQAREVLLSDDPPEALATLTQTRQRCGRVYPEWDYRLAAYRPAAATVWLQPCTLGDSDWAEQVMARHRRLLEEVRRRFEGLRPRRIQLNRQRDGDELDLDAYVDAFANLRAGHTVDDRLYKTSRPARRDLAISLLIDISGSTDAWVTEDLRIIDVEKEALLICCQALDALGDPYAIQAFSGEGPHGVAVWPVKEFDQHDRRLLQHRIAALQPERYTRAGAALRHATAQLAQRRERHRLLLLLSDGRPNDVDEYHGRYGIEDMRQAVVEAAAAGIHCFCLTVDRDAPSYLAAIFGPGQHAVLRHARRLPVALVEVLRRLLRQ